VAKAKNTVVTTASATTTNPSVMDELKKDMDILVNSGTGVTAATADAIPIPTVGELLKATDVQTAIDQITTAEGVCANCAHKSSNYSSNYSTNWGTNWNTNYGNNGAYWSNGQNMQY
jgi:hypothetical protein